MMTEMRSQKNLLVSRYVGRMERLSRSRPYGIRFRRQGAAAVEAALLSTFLVYLMIATIDIGQYANTVSIARNACRECARLAEKDATTDSSLIRQQLVSYMQNAFPNQNPLTIENATQIIISDRAGASLVDSDFDRIQSGDEFVVRVVFDFHAVRWMPLFDLWNVHFADVVTVGRRE